MTEQTQHATEQKTGKGRIAVSVIKFLVGVAVVAGAVAVAAYWMMNRPRAGRQAQPRKATPVTTRKVAAESHRVTVNAMGTVVPAEQVDMVARVSGQLTHVSPALVPGGNLEEGELIARVDQSDYELAVEQARSALEQAKLTCDERKLAIEQQTSNVAQAEKALTLEQAQQAVARQEYELLANEKGEMQEPALADRDISELPGMPESEALYRGLGGGKISDAEKSLILRQPQLKAAKAALKAARAGKQQAEVAYQNTLAAQEKARSALEKAELNLEWTTIEAPFDAVVRRKQVGKGSYVAPGNPIATLVNTDSYWVQVSVPVDKLKWIDAPTGNGDGSLARVNYPAGWGAGTHRRGRVKQLEPGIESGGRMARVIVEIPDPRALTEANEGKPVLLLDSYVEVELAGDNIENAIKVARTSVHEGNRVWVLGEDNTLEVREVEIGVSGPEHIYVTGGLEPGDALITSDIPTPVEGMSLRRVQTAEGDEDGNRGSRESEVTSNE